MRVDMSYDGPSFERVRRGGSRSDGEPQFSCGTKVRYRTERRASLALRWVERTFGHKVIYYCTNCRGHHLGGK